MWLPYMERLVTLKSVLIETITSYTRSQAFTVSYQAKYKNRTIGFQKTGRMIFQLRVILAYRLCGSVRTGINVARKLVFQY